MFIEKKTLEATPTKALPFLLIQQSFLAWDTSKYSEKPKAGRAHVSMQGSFNSTPASHQLNTPTADLSGASFTDFSLLIIIIANTGTPLLRPFPHISLPC